MGGVTVGTAAVKRGMVLSGDDDDDGKLSCPRSDTVRSCKEVVFVVGGGGNGEVVGTVVFR